MAKNNKNEQKTQRDQFQVTVDYDIYARYFENSNLSEADKRQIIDALWGVIVSFVQLGFGVHPAQSALTAKHLQKSEQNKNTSSHCRPDLLQSQQHSQQTSTREAAISSKMRPGEGVQL